MNLYFSFHNYLVPRFLRESPQTLSMQPCTRKLGWGSSLKLGQQIGGWGMTNSKPPGPIIMISQSETLISSYITFITLFFCRCTALLRLLLATAMCAIMLSQNHFPEPNRHRLDFPHPIYRAGSHTKHYWRCISNDAQYVTPDSTIYSEKVKMCQFSWGNWFFCTKLVQLAAAGKRHNNTVVHLQKRV